MFVMGNFLGAVARLLDLVLWRTWLIIPRLLSGESDPWNPVVQFTRVTEPNLALIRRRMSSWRMGIDLSPWSPSWRHFVQWFLVGTLETHGLEDAGWRFLARDHAARVRPKVTRTDPDEVRAF
jgi:uncharacterized protein YggT (Ycf19 family)